MLVKCWVSKFSVRATFRIAILLHAGAMNVQLCEASGFDDHAGDASSASFDPCKPSCCATGIAFA